MVPLAVGQCTIYITMSGNFASTPNIAGGACRVFKTLIALGKMELGSSPRIINPCQAATSFTLHPIGRSRRKGLV